MEKSLGPGPLLLAGMALTAFLVHAGTPGNAAAYEIWVTNQWISTSKVQVINSESLQVVAEIKTGIKPHTITFSRDGRRAYVANIRSNDFTVIDAVTRTPITTVPAGKLAHHVAVSPDDRLLLVSNRNEHTVMFFDAQSFKRLKTLPVGHRPAMAAFTPDGRTVYVTINDDMDRLTGDPGYVRHPSIAVIDVVKMEVSGSIAIPGNGAMAVRITSDGTKVIVGGGPGNDKYYIIDTATDKVVAEGVSGKDAHGVALTPDNRYAVIPNRLSNDVAVVDMATGKIAATIAEVGDKPSLVDVSPDGTRAFVTLFGAPEPGDPRYRISGKDAGVSVLDLTQKKVLTILRLGGDPYGIAVRR